MIVGSLMNECGIVFIGSARVATKSERQVPTAHPIVICFLVWEGVKNMEIFLRFRNQFGSEW